MERKIVVLRYLDLADLEAKLEALGVAVNAPVDEGELRVEGHIERCNTPEMVTTMGKILTVWASAESAALMSDVMPPEVLVDYVEGELEEVEIEDIDPETGKTTTTTVQLPCDWPIYPVETEDGLTTRAAPRIMA